MILTNVILTTFISCSIVSLIHMKRENHIVSLISILITGILSALFFINPYALISIPLSVAYYLFFIKKY